MSAADSTQSLLQQAEINTLDRSLKFKAVWFDLDDTLW